MNTKKRLYLMIAAVALIVVIVCAVRFLYTPDTAAFIEEQIYLIQEGSSDFPDYPEGEKEVLNIGVGNITGDFDPRTASTAGDRAVSRLIYQPLVAADRSGYPVAVLAKDYEISSDGLTYTFHIPTNLKFSDGSEVTCEDIKENILSVYEDELSSENPTSINDNKISFHFEQADKDHIWLFQLGIQPASQLDAGKVNKEYLGTGAYQIDTDGAGDYSEILLTVNEYSRIKNIKTEQVKLIQSDNSALSALFGNGRIDMAYFGYDNAAVEKCRENPYLDIYTTPGNSSSYLGMNFDNSALSDLSVRQAMAYGINYEAILNLYNGAADINPSPFSSVSWQTPEGIEAFVYDPKEAEQILADEGYHKNADGLLEKGGAVLSLRLAAYQGSSTRIICEMLAADLEQLGIQISVEIYDYSEFSKKVFLDRDFDLYYGSWQYGLEDNIMERFGTPGAGVNPENWYPDELADLMDQLTEETDYKKLEKTYHQIARLYHEQIPQIPLDTPRSIVAASSSIQGLRLSPYVAPYWNLEEITVSK